MNTSKQINIMILLLFFSVLVTAGYTLWDSTRANDAEEEQLHATIRRGAYLFSQNCRSCHGDAGEGGQASNRLRAAPALNRPDLRGVVEGEVTDVTFANAYKFVYDTISCGRVGKFMPAWAQLQGGTLNDEQIKQLTEFITRGGEEGWAIAAEFGRFNDHDLHLETGDDRNELSLAEAIGEDDTVLRLNNLVKGGVATVNPNERLSILEEVEEPEEPVEGEEEPDGEAEEEVVIPEVLEIMLVVENGVDLEAGTVTVERGVGSTAPLAHAAGTHLLQPPSAPAEPVITERSCGQTASADTAEACGAADAATELTIVAQGTAWNKTTLCAVAGQPLSVSVDNRDGEAGTLHNFRVFGGPDPEGDPVAATEVAQGPITQELDFGPLDAGDYYYDCEVHAQMGGTLTAFAAGAATDAPPADADATPAP